MILHFKKLLKNVLDMFGAIMFSKFGVFYQLLSPVFFVLKKVLENHPKKKVGYNFQNLIFLRFKDALAHQLEDFVNFFDLKGQMINRKSKKKKTELTVCNDRPRTLYVINYLQPLVHPAIKLVLYLEFLPSFKFPTLRCSRSVETPLGTSFGAFWTWCNEARTSPMVGLNL